MSKILYLILWLANMTKSDKNRQKGDLEAAPVFCSKYTTNTRPAIGVPKHLFDARNIQQSEITIK
jgi:hypothetical protein